MRPRGLGLRGLGLLGREYVVAVTFAHVALGQDDDASVT